MDVEKAVSRIAAAIGEPARARMLYCLMDDRARTCTELAMVAEVSPSTASVHLNRLRTERLVRVRVQGKHHYYCLESSEVAAALEGLGVLAGAQRDRFVPSTPSPLLFARTCYDHMAGRLGVALHDRLDALGCLSAGGGSYDCTAIGEKLLQDLSLDVAAIRALRRRFAYGCLDWSERRPHMGGALGAALLKLALRRRWIAQELDSRCLRLTAIGRREMAAHFGVQL